MNRLTYPSKIDWWLGLILFGFPAIFVALAIGFHKPLLLAPSVLLAAIDFAVAIPSAYVFLPDSLEIRSGMIRRRLAYAEINSAQPSRNPLASFALSLDRVDIRYGTAKQVLISPKSQSAFLQELAARVPHLTVLPRA